MTRNKFELDRIAVASPCSVAWDEMEGDDRVRFCNRCSLNVYNISAMTKAEAESVITNTEGRVCASFYRRADGTILTQDCPVGLWAARKRISRVAAAAFSAIVSLFGGQAHSRAAARRTIPRLRSEERLDDTGNPQLREPSSILFAL